MAQRFIEPIARIFTNAGAVGVGYKYYFYQNKFLQFLKHMVFYK